MLAVAVACGLGLAPAASRAQGAGSDPAPFATVKAYEVQEATDLKGDPQDPALRLANAAIVGQASGRGLCTAGQDPCAFNTVAVSKVPFKIGVGPLSGDFQVMFDTMMNPGHLLSDLVLVADGSVRGQLDLRPLLNRTAPWALMKGRWKSKKLDARGTFSGVFLVPFLDQTKQCATGFGYLRPDPDDPSNPPVFECLESTEISLGRPVTKLLAKFNKTGPFQPGDDDDDDSGGHGNK
jgi:hypothetical protein